MSTLEPLVLGMMSVLDLDPVATFGRVRQLGFTTCQLNSPPLPYLTGPDAVALTDRFRAAHEASGVAVTCLHILFPPCVWDLHRGPRTIGLVPADLRGPRVVKAIRVGHWAQSVGIDTLAAHVGFIPEDPDDPAYEPVIATLRALIDYLTDQGLRFAFETGQETPASLVRAIGDIDRGPAVGVNFDPANLLLYGKGVPLEAVPELAPLVFNTHCKDGLPPAPGQGLGREVPLGTGQVDIELLIAALWRHGYRGPLTIEREIEGDEQTRDILAAKVLLERIRGELAGG